jgi:hypothetical protein
LLLQASMASTHLLTRHARRGIRRAATVYSPCENFLEGVVDAAGARSSIG